MKGIINLYSETSGEIKKFLELFFDNSKNFEIQNDLFWEISYENPINMIELVSCFIDNKENFKINIWISIDDGIFINVTEQNLDEIIKYIYERFPNN